MKHRAALSRLAEAERHLERGQQLYMRNEDPSREAALAVEIDARAALVSERRAQLFEVQEEWRAAEQVKLP